MVLLQKNEISHPLLTFVFEDTEKNSKKVNFSLHEQAQYTSCPVLASSLHNSNDTPRKKVICA